MIPNSLSKLAGPAIAMLLLLPACSETQISDSRTQFAVLQSSFTSAEILALGYVRLPPCQLNAFPLCSDDKVVSTIQQAAGAANVAIVQARVVFSNTSAEQSALLQALNIVLPAVQAFQAIVAGLPQTPPATSQGAQL